MFFKKKTSEVKLKMLCTTEEVCDGRSFIFSVTTDGKASDKGFLIAISGDAVDNGELKLSQIELHRLKGIKFEVVKYGLKKSEKKNGGYSYNLSLKNFYIPEKERMSSSLLRFNGNKSKAQLSRIEDEFQFKLKINYTSQADSEFLVGVFPYENLLAGGCSKWVKLKGQKYL